MHRTSINIATRLVEASIRDSRSLDALLLAIRIKMLRVHSVYRFRTDNWVSELAGLLHCSKKIAMRLLDASRGSSLFVFGENYIKVKSFISDYAYEGKSRKTKTHGHLRFTGVHRLSVRIEDGSLSRLRNQLRKLITLDSIRRTYHAMNVRSNKSTTMVGGGGTSTVYSAGYCNVTRKYVSRLVGVSLQKAGDILREMVTEGLICKRNAHCSVIGNVSTFDFSSESSYFVCGGNVLKMVPCSYRIASSKALRRTGHLIVNHSLRNGVPQVEERETCTCAYAIDPSNPSYKYSDYTRAFGQLEGIDML